jgi:hypothetical protein
MEKREGGQKPPEPFLEVREMNSSARTLWSGVQVMESGCRRKFYTKEVRDVSRSGSGIRQRAARI